MNECFLSIPSLKLRDGGLEGGVGGLNLNKPRELSQDREREQNLVLG